MNPIFHEKTGYLIKCLATGEIDTETMYPILRDTPPNPDALVDGYVWVEVVISYREREQNPEDISNEV